MRRTSRERGWETMDGGPNKAGGVGRTRRPALLVRLVPLAVVPLLALIFAGLAPAGAFAEESTHLFDPTLSLTGSCATEALDPVPDPGCPAGAHPPRRFKAPHSETTDEFGDIYVVSRPGTEEEGAVIDIFDSSGNFLTEVQDHHSGLQIAVDSKGNLYVNRSSGLEIAVVRYEPEVYEPQSGRIEYKETPAVVLAAANGALRVAIDRSNDHLYIGRNDHIEEYGSAAEGNPLIDGSIGQGVLSAVEWFTVDASNHDVYADSTPAGGSLRDPAVIKVLSGEPGHPLIRTITGSCLPDGHFDSNVANGISVAIDESNGHVFVDDRATSNFEHATVDEFTETGECVSMIEHGFQFVFPSQIAIDNGAHSPNGALDPDGRYLFVPSGELANKSHLYAFAPVPKLREAPAVESAGATAISMTEAELTAKVNPRGSATHYTIEYTSQASFEAEEFQAAQVAGEGDLAAGTLGVEVSAAADGLSPGTAYRFRVVAENACEPSGCTDEREASFSTFSLITQSGSCDNAGLRVGASAALPDCRAYELVTPPDTGGRPVVDPVHGNAGDFFGTPTASPDGDSVGFMVFGGVIAGTEGAGGFSGTPYVATRGVQGWSTEGIGMSGTQSTNPNPGGLSAEHGYAISTAAEGGSLPIDGGNTDYIRYPDGSFHLLGAGSIGVQPLVRALYIAPGGTHTIFTSGTTGSTPIQLEPDAPQAGIAALYDRTPDGALHVISLLPGNVTPGEHEAASFEAASGDGSVVAFKIGDQLYARLHDAETVEVGGPGATLAGISTNGRFAFYLLGGDLYRDDTQTEAVTRITEAANVAVVNVPAEGTGAYFVSQRVLTVDRSPTGAVAQEGEENLYFWDGVGLRFVGAMTKRDVEGEFTGGGGFQLDGLGLWTSAFGDGLQAVDPSRSTPNGNALLFESRANLTGYDSGGKAEVYLYGAQKRTLRCLSCDPTGIAAASNAILQSLFQAGRGEATPAGRFAIVPNLSTDGNRAFFESSDPLVPEDTDGVQDVYEWEAEGEGTCGSQGGCLFLISSGHSAHDNFLFGVSESGDDVFIGTSDLLVPADGDETSSIYDARAEGGFPTSSRAAECLGEACQPTPVVPVEKTPASSTFEGAGNVHSTTSKAVCPKGRTARKKGSKTRCVGKKKQRGKTGHGKKPKTHHRHNAHRRANSDRRAKK
jgi:hypothetical protein